MKKEILVFCPSCHKRLMIPREYKHPLSVKRINIEYIKCADGEEPIAIYLDKFDREINPMTGKLV